VNGDQLQLSSDQGTYQSDSSGCTQDEQRVQTDLQNGDSPDSDENEANLICGIAQSDQQRVESDSSQLQSDQQKLASAESQLQQDENGY